MAVRAPGSSGNTPLTGFLKTGGWKPPGPASRMAALRSAGFQPASSGIFQMPASSEQYSVKAVSRCVLSIPDADAGAEGAAVFVILTQGLTVAGEILQLDGRVKMGTKRQVEPQIEQQTGMAAFVADAEPGGELNFFPAPGFVPGQGTEQIAVTAISRQVRVIAA